MIEKSSDIFKDGRHKDNYKIATLLWSSPHTCEKASRLKHCLITVTGASSTVR